MSKAVVRKEKQLRFMRAMTKAMEGEPLSQFERNLLFFVFEALMAGKDARPLVGTEPPAQRPADPKVAHRSYWCACDIAHLVVSGMTVTVAKRTAEERWRMTEDQVRVAWLNHRLVAREFVQRIGGSAKQAIEAQRRRVRSTA